MLRSLKTILGAGVLALTALSAGAFSLLGPANEFFQTPDLSYGTTAPKNLAEGYRWNLPVLYFACDQNFLDYFGSNGLAQITAAFDAFNALPPVSGMSTNLSEFPLEAMRVNYRAQALHLLDLKSQTMAMLTTQLGLASPDHWTWCLHQRTPNQNNSFDYVVIKRNFDPLTQIYSSYVNGTLYTYYIQEFPNQNRGDAIELLVDPLASQFTALAAGNAGQGDYYTGWTRDDVGGFRYQLSPTLLPNTETVVDGVQQILTNAATELLVTSNLVDLANNALTNDAPALQAIYPDLVITGTTNYFTNLFATNYTYYYTNTAFGVTNKLVTVVTLTPFVATNYLHSFGNVVTNHSFPSYTVIQQTVLLTNYPSDPVGTPKRTNTINTPIIVNQTSGDFYLIPATNGCGISVLSTQMTNLVTVTNSSSIPVPPPPPGTNDVSRLLGQTNLTVFTSYTLVAYRVLCPAGTNALRRGIDKITFVRRDYDSLLGQFFAPVTNTFTYREVVNNTEFLRTYRRIVTAPDFLITARDLGTTTPPSNPPFNAPDPIFVTSSNYPGLAGPGIIVPSVTFTYNKVGPMFQNSGPSSITEASATFDFLWGSYDGTTNEPVVYPSTTSIQNLDNQLIMRVNNPIIPAARVGSAFSYTLSGSGGEPPYVWTFVPNQFGLPSGLPPGLNLQSNGLIFGTPTTHGTYNFVVRITDSASRFVEQPLTITVNP